MNELKKQVKESFRMEMIGTGIYHALSRQYKKSPEISNSLKEFSQQEEMHGKLFKQYYKKTFGKSIKGESFWQFAGRAAAIVMRPLSLETKLKKIGAAESQAVFRIEKALAGGEDTGYHKIIRRILPDEKAHAALHGQLYT